MSSLRFLSTPLTRRQLLVNGLRLGVVAGAVTLVVAKVQRPAAPDRAGETCHNNQRCRACPILAACGLPLALSVKEHLSHGGK